MNIIIVEICVMTIIILLAMYKLYDNLSEQNEKIIEEIEKLNKDYGE